MYLLVQNDSGISVTHIIEEHRWKPLEEFILDLSSGKPYMRIEELPPLPIEHYEIVNGQLIKKEGDFSPPEPPQWGYFATAMVSSNECRTWFNQVATLSPFDATALMPALTNQNPSVDLIQAILDGCIGLVAPPETLIEYWEQTAQTYHVPLRFRPQQ